MGDRLLSGGRNSDRSKEKRQKVPGRGPGVAKLERLLRLDNGSSFVIAAEAPLPETGVGLLRPPHPAPLTSMISPPFVQVLQSSPSLFGQISVEPPSNQRFHNGTSSFFGSHQGDLMANLKWHHPRVDNTTCATISNHQPLNLYSDMIAHRHRDTNYMKWNNAEPGRNFHESMKNEVAEGSCPSNTVPFYNFIQPKETLEDSGHEIVEGESMNLDLDLELKL